MRSAIRVAIIGAGAAGLCAGKKCIQEGFDTFIFEQWKNVGGTWVIGNERDSHSSMYENLRTNLPKEIMAFSDHRFPDELPSFIYHYDVLNYLQTYSNDIMNHVKLNSKIIRVERCDSKWCVTYLDSEREEKSTSLFDVVFICNGHYSKPYVPQVPGEFTGSIFHSHTYRNPTKFAGKTVAVVGAGPSGTDIALQLADVSSKVYLLHDGKIKSPLPNNIIELPSISRFDRKNLVLNDGSIISVDSILYCTGYLYDFLFLDHVIDLKYDRKMISPTYLHVAHTKYLDSLFFIGLNSTVIPFLLFEVQIDFAIAMINGKVSLDNEEVQGWEEQHLRKLSEQGISGEFFHRLADDQWDYFEILRKKSGLPLLDLQLTRHIYEETAERRSIDLVGYKSFSY